MYAAAEPLLFRNRRFSGAGGRPRPDQRNPEGYDGGRKKYSISNNALDMDEKDDASYIQVLKNSLVSMEYSENIIVIKTVAGMAMAVGASVDRLKIDEIMGCIAGDDTLFLAIISSEIKD